MVREDNGGIGLMFMDSGRETLSFFEDYNGPLYVDGTFYVVPSHCGFDNLLTVHLDFKGHTFPVFYFLLSGRSEQMYRAALRKVVDFLPPGCNISHCMSDFEMALLKACQAVFEKPCHGCWFHYSQALMKRIRSTGLAQSYRTNDHVRHLLQKFMALPLLPSDQIEECFQILNNDHVPNATPVLARKLQQFKRYLERFWIRKIQPQRMSVHGLDRRSNNTVESFHSMLKRKIKSPHPNLFVFLENVNNIIKNKLADMKCLANDRQISRRKPRAHLQKEECLSDLEAQLRDETITPVQFLERSVMKFHRYVGDVGDDEPLTEEENHSDQEANEPELPEPQEPAQDEAEGAAPEEAQARNTCPVCLTVPRSAVLTPCGHSACYTCADTIFKMAPPANKCQECRQPIASVVRVFGMS